MKDSKLANIYQLIFYSISWIGFSQLIRAFVQVISVIVLSRLLSSNDFGIYALFAAITALFQRFKDVGISTVIIQEKNLDHSTFSSLFIFNFLISLLSILVLVLLADMISEFYDQPEIKILIYAGSLFFVLSSISVPYDAILRREMKFSTIAKIDIFIFTFGVLLATLHAFFYRNYWSIFIFSFAPIFAHFFIMIYISEWHPTLKSNFKQSANKIHKGLYHFCTALMVALSSQAIYIVGSSFFVTEDIGNISRALTIIMIFPFFIITPISSIFFSGLSKIRNNKKEFKALSDKILFFGFLLSSVLSIFIFFNAENIINILLGSDPQWSKSIMLLKILSFVIISETIWLISNSIFLAHGYVKILFVFRSVEAFLIFGILIIGFSSDLYLSISHFAISFTAIKLLSSIILYITIFKNIKTRQINT